MINYYSYRSVTTVEKECPFCHKSFVGSKGKKYCSRKCYGQSIRGEANPRWDPNRGKGQLGRRSPADKRWKKSVLERDNYTCVWCGSESNIEVDHIKPWSKHPELRFNLDNGRTLCHNCHCKTSTYGSKILKYKSASVAKN